FDLTEEWPRAVELVMTPVLQEPLGRTDNLPVSRIAQRPPAVDIAADFIDQSVFGVGFEVKRPLILGGLLPRCGYQNDEPRRPASPSCLMVC
ncbi:hypothetical protein, partial [Rhodopseudomonas sp. BR0G17]|uniref:hypothetical protein n=1 Tax=Rhodopseudomonas sp. BR0G17 TaxID=2269368 RepID=UPI0019677556